MAVISREQARTERKNHFNTGKPCNKGHMADRDVLTGDCIKCMKIAKAKYLNQKHREDLLAHPEKMDDVDLVPYYLEDAR